ncbi:hypothetical protein [Stetteria hydrogenophila]
MEAGEAGAGGSVEVRATLSREAFDALSDLAERLGVTPEEARVEAARRRGEL